MRLLRRWRANCKVSFVGAIQPGPIPAFAALHPGYEFQGLAVNSVGGHAPSALPYHTSFVRRALPTLRPPRRHPPQEFMRELRKRIVARTHDHDAVAGAGQTDERVAAAAAVRKR